MTHRIAIDVGSGYTNVKTNEQEILFVSRVCLAPQGWRNNFGSSQVRVCQVGNKEWILGEGVRAMGGLAENSLSHEWALSEGWRVLFYSAIAEIGISGDVIVCTGLPQATYRDQRDQVVNRLFGEHEFVINGITHKIRVVDVFVAPQATGALLYQVSLDPHMTGDAGCVDVGTFTTGLAVINMETQALQVSRSNGMALGVATLISALGSYLDNRFGVRLDGSRLMFALQQQKTKVRGEVIDLSQVIREIALREAKPMLEFIQDVWDGGADLDVFLAGGGADYFAQSVRSVVPHAQVIPEPQRAVARGLYIYMDLCLDKS